MYLITPKSISKPAPFLIECKWSDGFQSTITLEKLREECPCAHCSKEKEKKTKSFALPMMKTFDNGMNELKALKPVGNYAIKPEWGDSHDDGIYDWDYLRRVFEKHALELSEIERYMNMGKG
jgi:DUF971 family protein